MLGKSGEPSLMDLQLERLPYNGQGADWDFFVRVCVLSSLFCRESTGEIERGGRG